MGGATFQELNEKAKKMQNGGAEAGDFDLSDLMGDLGDLDPKMFEGMKGLGGDFDDVMKIIGDLTPEQVQQRMEEMVDIIQGGDIMKNVLGMREEIIDAMEKQGQVSPEELAKLKNDPDLFEKNIRDGFEMVQD